VLSSYRKIEPLVGKFFEDSICQIFDVGDWFCLIIEDSSMRNNLTCKCHLNDDESTSKY
jgi:hypothetical protein